MEDTTPFRFKKQSSKVSYSRLIVAGMLCLLLPRVSLSITCSTGFYVSGTKCLNCSAAISYCSTCTSSSNCTTCSTGYYRSPSGISCFTCAVDIDGCGSCTSSSPSSCTYCYSGYKLRTTSPYGCEYTGSTASSASGGSTGGIVGGVIGGAVLVGILVGIYCCCKKRTTLAQQQNPQAMAQMLGARTPGGGQSALVMGNSTQMGGYPGQPGGFPGDPSFNPYSQPPGLSGPGLQPLQPAPGYGPTQPYNPPVPIAQVGMMAGGYSNPQANAWQGQNNMGFEQQPFGGQMGPNQNAAALPPGFK